MSTITTTQGQQVGCCDCPDCRAEDTLSFSEWLDHHQQGEAIETRQTDFDLATACACEHPEHFPHGSAPGHEHLAVRAGTHFAVPVGWVCDYCACHHAARDLIADEWD